MVFKNKIFQLYIKDNIKLMKLIKRYARRLSGERSDARIKFLGSLSSQQRRGEENREEINAEG